MKLAQHYAHRDTSEWGPLFHRILQSRIRDWYRRSKVRNKWLGWLGRNQEGDSTNSDAIDLAPDPAAREPEQILATRQDLNILENGIANLPARQQQAFLLRVWEGLNVAQTAKAMNCSIGSVKTHYSRALQALRGHLKDN